MKNERARRASMRHGPTILCSAALQYSGVPVQQVLHEAGYRALCLPPTGFRMETTWKSNEPPSLVVLELDCRSMLSFDWIRAMRRHPGLRDVAILGITDVAELRFDVATLRAFGIVGVLDRRADRATLVERIRNTLRQIAAGRRAARVDCLFPLNVGPEAIRRMEFARDLSTSGIRLTSAVPLEPNMDLDLRFCLRMVSDRELAAMVRVIHVLPLRNSWGRREAGAVFTSLNPEARRVVSTEVERLARDVSRPDAKR